MSKMQIKNRWDNTVIYEGEAESLRLLILSAVRAGKALRDADLSRANLSDADLSDANLSRANLSRANLSRANLSDANLSDADLSDANLSRANLSRANLSDANLSDADLSDADLSRANLIKIRDDFFAVLSSAPQEVPALRTKIIAGEINGTTYEGPCACLVGTIANAKGCDYQKIPNLVPDSSRAIERFFMGIKQGQTPENHQPSKIVLEWLDTWYTRMQLAFGSSPTAPQPSSPTL